MGDIPVLGIHEIAFEARGLERSIAFYRDILGLPLYLRGPQQAWFCIETQRLALFTHVRPGGGQHFALLIPPGTQSRRAQSFWGPGLRAFLSRPAVPAVASPAARLAMV